MLDITQWIAQHIGSTGLDDDAGLLVLAALDGDTELYEHLTDGPAPARSIEEAAAEIPSHPAGAFLRSVRVSGFRGIGGPVTLDITPQPGLTIVAGRNGSGKSSLAEALEVALTGSTYRWKEKKSTQWKGEWRNLHQPHPAAIRIALTEEEYGLTTLGVDWKADDVSPESCSRWVQRAGQKREPGMTALGWEQALATHRPMMSYDELGGLLEQGPSALYDALSSSLGLELVGAAVQRLADRERTHQQVGTAATKQRKGLVAACDNVADERAEAARSLLSATSPDLEALRDLATGQSDLGEGALGWLRGVAQVRVPAVEEVEAARTGLSVALDALIRTSQDDLEGRRARTDVLGHALVLHERFGDQNCPVCETGSLDADWATSGRRRAEAERRDVAALDAAHGALDEARRGAHRLLQPRPDALGHCPVLALQAGVERLRAAWDTWSRRPASDVDLADHLRARLPELQAAHQALVTAVAAELAARHDAWSPLASQVAAFCLEWEQWLAIQPTAQLLKRARVWLDDADTALKNQRLEPITEQVRDAWSALRHESNVDISALVLEGTRTRRRVRIDATVDGTDTRALAVMSQGELHALSLALFLPRATSPESPFRFVVLDDPVQAMDPAKVEGLVDLLSALGRTHQVIVLSHDDRLPAAARRAAVDARIIEVSRGERSEVSLHSALDPTARYLDDARALVRDENLPENTLRRVLPGLLRLAVESAARERWFGQRLADGERLADLEDHWGGVKKTGQRVCLAVFGDQRDLSSWLARPHRKVGLGIVTSGVHTGLNAGTAPRTAVDHVGDLVRDVQQGVRS